MKFYIFLYIFCFVIKAFSESNTENLNLGIKDDYEQHFSQDIPELPKETKRLQSISSCDEFKVGFCGRLESLNLLLQSSNLITSSKSEDLSSKCYEANNKDEFKKIYKKVTLLAHPDKLRENIPNEKAKEITNALHELIFELDKMRPY